MTIDCPDAGALSAFWAAVVGGDRLRFRQVGDYRPPRWPDPAHPQQLHLDVTVADPDAAEAAVLGLGATSLGARGTNWRVYADPAGKPFCLCWD
ncbi:VOC family protein [Spirilliplanes yamanashiensis]|uniref:Glyoxalase n=1 Tax=Spirilliplanes yamanashiensis TaxID=42233 RepID=A0A8J3Y772_9ACTN|nr:VOC family protein [Spirilliplanes yamanashiensis]MDP9815035.1 hypothetical protein [Spirilliplanes yamanashiensis]GIJ02692.1 glyoxalase [Spirilliplanes yamanashiensis]